MGRIQGEKHEQISAEQSRQVMVLTADPWKFFFFLLLLPKTTWERGERVVNQGLQPL